MFLKIWQSLPLPLRRLFYSLPLFLQWWPAFYWEEDKRALEISRTALAYFLLFLGGSLVSFAVHFFGVSFFQEKSTLLPYYFVFYMQLLWSLMYIIFSLLLSCEAFRGKQLNFLEVRVLLPLKIIKRLESLFI